MENRFPDRKSASNGVLIFVIAAPIAFVLLGSQWLVTVPVGPVFFTDPILLTSFLGGIALIVGHRLLNHAAVGLSLLFLSLPVWASVKLFLGDLSLQSLREFHPFLVLSYSVPLMLLLAQSSSTSRRIVSNIVLVALTAHSVSLIIKMFLSSLGVRLPQISGSTLFDSGPHVDGLIASIFFAFLTWKAIQLRALKAVILSLAGMVVLVILLSLENRAALLSASVLWLHAVVIGLISIGRKNGIWVALRAGLLQVSVVTVAYLVSAKSRNAFLAEFLGGFEYGTAKFADSLDSESNGTISAFGADAIVEDLPGSGTVRARLDAWDTLWTWFISDSSRVLLGEGFGSNYLWNSGAAVALRAGAEESDGNKWVHNHLLTISVTLGVLATLVFLLCCVVAYLLLLRDSISGEEILSLFALFALLGVSVTSLLGVIFENPWGSVPFAWSLGVAGALHLRARIKNQAASI